ncbi:MAG: hydroxymethylbilane synthase [Saprospiraceae bacterium]|nr:hydroxymethylbilane synthase [Saprospiraceae bacterium]
MKLRIGTRGSALALWQAQHTQAELQKIDVASELVIISTKGDQIQHLGFDKMEGKGFFTKEIEEALLLGEVHVAVHSMKDLSTQQPEGLVVAAVSYREDPSDRLLVRPEAYDPSQPFRLCTGAVVGTSAARRKAQILDFRPDVRVKDLRGNVPTRVDKLRAGDYDAIFLAGAGLERLQLDVSDLQVLHLQPREFVPAPAQGVLAWQTHRDDMATRRLFSRLHHPLVAACTNVERSLLRLLDGGCQLPLGAFCERDANGHYHAWAACVVDNQMRRARVSQTTHEGMAERLLAQLDNPGTI